MILPKQKPWSDQQQSNLQSWYASTFNGGTTTNITLQTCWCGIEDEEIDEINAVKGHLPRMQAIFDKGCALEYNDIDHPVFKNSQPSLDCCMPQFIANCLKEDSKSGSTSSIKDCVSEVAKQNPWV